MHNQCLQPDVGHSENNEEIVGHERPQLQGLIEARNYTRLVPRPLAISDASKRCESLPETGDDTEELVTWKNIFKCSVLALNGPVGARSRVAPREQNPFSATERISLRTRQQPIPHEWLHASAVDVNVM